MIYVDDSGTKDYAKPGQAYGSSGGPSRYFVYGGVLGRRDTTAMLAQEIKKLKTSTFGTTRVEIKSHWLRRPDKRNRHYLEPHQLTEEELTGFVEAYYDMIIAAEVRLVAAVIDKQHMRERYGIGAYSPSAAAYELLAQRIANELGSTGSTCGIVLDDMTGANPQGSPYKNLLLKQHRNLRKNGSRLMRGLSMECLDSLTFKDSALSDLVQVADIVSFNVLRQFREHGEEWEDRGLRNLPTYHYFSRLAGKFRQGPGGRIQGYGVAKLPLRTRVPWAVKQRAAP